MIAKTRKLMRKALNFEIEEGRRLGEIITNAESNMLVRQCMKIVFFDEPNDNYSRSKSIDFNPYSAVSRMANDLAEKRLAEKGASMSVEDLLKESVACVEIKFYLREHRVPEIDFDKAYDEIYKKVDALMAEKSFEEPSAMDRFLSDAAGSNRIAYITDDNGEIAYHLYIIQRLLEKNPHLIITLIPRGGHYHEDASYQDVMQLLDHPLYAKLKGNIETKNFRVLEHDSKLGAIDLMRNSSYVIGAIKESDLIFSVGSVNFEMLNSVNKANYHILRVTSSTSILATVHKKGDYIFAYHEPATRYLDHINDKLNEGRTQKLFIRGKDEKINIPVSLVCQYLKDYSAEYPHLATVINRVIADIEDVKDQMVSIEDMFKLFPDPESNASRRFVVTGAPFAGKTHFLKNSLKDIPEYGKDIIWIPEVVEILKKAGIDYRNSDKANRLIFMLHYLLEREAAIEHPDKIVITDRGTLDTYAYFKGNPDKFLEEAGGRDKNLARYNAVFIFESVAASKSARKEYRDRKENPKDARKLEKKLEKVWRSHSKLYKIPHINWEQKTIKAKEILYSTLDQAFSARTDSLIYNCFETLRSLSISFWFDKASGSDIKTRMSTMSIRRDIAYETSRSINKWLVKYKRRLKPDQHDILIELYTALRQYARGNSLFLIPETPGIHKIDKKFIRTADVRGEEFMFFTLDRNYPFHSFPYQITFSKTPPDHDQEIHGHYFTKELTVSLGEGMYYEIYKFENGKIIDSKKVHVKPFQGTGYGVNTPHIIGNQGSSQCPNITAKFDEGIHDRWNREENPDESTYSYDSGIVEPAAVRTQNGATTRTFDKEHVVYNIVELQPGSKISVNFPLNNERGIFIAQGEVKAAYNGSSSAVIGKEGDILYAIKGDNNNYTVENASDKTAVIFYTDIKVERILEKFRVNALTNPFKAVLVDIDGVLTIGKSRKISDKAISKLIYLLEQGIPVCLVTGRNRFSDDESVSPSVESVLEVIRSKLKAKNKDDLLKILFAASENGLVITNGYSENTNDNFWSSENGFQHVVTSAVQNTIEHKLYNSGLSPADLTIIRKDHSMEISITDKTKIESIYNTVSDVLKILNISDNVDLTRSDRAIYIYPAGTDKINALCFMKERFGLSDNDVAAFGDSAAEDQPDYSMVNRKGGFSVNTIDGERSEAISLRQLGNEIDADLSFDKGFIWTIDRLSFFSPLPEHKRPVSLADLQQQIKETAPLHEKDRKERWVKDTQARIGLNTNFVPKEDEIDYQRLLTAFNKAVLAKSLKINTLTDEDYEFLKIYGTIFSKEYYTARTISGYWDYKKMPGKTNPRIDAIIKHCGLQPEDRVLDIGCAFGFYVERLRELGIDAQGLEISPYAVGRADFDTRKYIHLMDSKNVLQNFIPGQFDLVILKDVLEHVPLDILPRFLGSVLPLGKKILISLPFTDKDGNFINSEDEQDITHVVRKTKNWWIAELSKYGTVNVNTDELNKSLKEKGKDIGTLCVILTTNLEHENRGPEHIPAPAYSGEDLKNIPKMIAVMRKNTDGVRHNTAALMTQVTAFFKLYATLVRETWPSDDDFMNLLIERMRSAVAETARKEYSENLFGPEGVLDYTAALLRKDRLEDTDAETLYFIIDFFASKNLLPLTDSVKFNIYRVMKKLFEEPYCTSDSILSDLQISTDTLKTIYRYLNCSQLFQDLMYKKSRDSATMDFYRYFLKDKVRMNALADGKQPFPVVLEIHPSLVCQNRCVQCFNEKQMSYVKKPGSKLLTKERVRSLLDEAKEKGVNEVVITGGFEPLLSELTVFILDYAYEIGLPTVLVTNGRALSDERFYPSVLKAKKIRVSMYTSDAGSYDKITRVGQEALHELINSIKKLQKFKIDHNLRSRIGLLYQVLPINYNDMKEFPLLAKELGVDFVDYRHDLMGTGKDETLEWLTAVKDNLNAVKSAAAQGLYGNMSISYSPKLNHIATQDIHNGLPLHVVPIESRVCRARNLRVIVNPFGEVYSCSQRSQPGLCGHKYFVGALDDNESLEDFLNRTSAVHVPTEDCGFVCNNLDKFYNNIQERLIADKAIGIDVSEQPYSADGGPRPLKIALMGTAMVRAEPTKKDDYFKGKIQKKLMQPPFGVYRLAHYLEKIFASEIAAGRLRVDVFDPALSTVSDDEKLDDIFKKVRENGYDIIGFSPIRILLGEDLHFMNRVREEAVRSGHTPLFIAGGNEASANTKDMFSTMPWLDYCIHGLGEPIIERIAMRAFSGLGHPINKAQYKDIGGLLYSENGDIRQNECRRTTPDEFRHYAVYAGENIPYDKYWKHNRSIGPVDTTYSGTTIETVRLFTRNFCPFNCGFCSQSSWGRKIYEGPPTSLTVDQIADIIKTSYEKKGAKGVYFNDDDMFGERNNAYNILKKIIEMKEKGMIPRDMRFYGQTRVDGIDKGILDLMKEAGFVFLSFGAESFADESLQAPDLKKHFKADQAIKSVTRSLEAHMPITNINLILFHPTIKRNSLIKTIETTCGLLEESIKLRSRLSVNAFPLIEDYAGAPIKTIAEKESWPIKTSEAVYGGKTYPYIESYLPIDPEMRKVVENDRLIKEFDAIMQEITHDKRWPSETVSRSIGINGLVMFMACYKLMGVKDTESSVSIEKMKDLLFRVIDTFNPSIEKTANILNSQKANVVYTFENGKPIFRRGSIKIEGIPEEVLSELAKINKEEVLLSLIDSDPQALLDAISDAVYGHISLADSFLRHGINAYKSGEFKKVLLLVPAGNYDGSPLKTVVPHLGVEQIAYSLIRDKKCPFVDCRVFNPNLAGRDRINTLLEKEKFDVVGFSFLPVTLKNDAALIDKIAKACPDAILLAGGLNIARMPHEEIFGAVPFDVFIAGPGERSIADIMSVLSTAPADRDKPGKLFMLRNIPNLCIYDGHTMVRTKRVPFIFEKIDERSLLKDIPYTKPDLTHGKSYTEKSGETHHDILPYDMIGTRRLYVKISDRCTGNCIFCSAPKDKVKPEEIENIIKSIKENRNDFDSIHFSDNSLLVDKDLAVELCKEIIFNDLADIPKFCKARTDEADPETLAWLQKAGFKIITFGVESFDDSVLAEMEKDTTGDTNKKAVEMALSAGLKPGMDMIFFSPWENRESLIRSLDAAIEFVSKGAYLSIVPEMHVQLGDRFSKENKGDIEYEDLAFESTGQIFRSPKRAVIPPEMASLRAEILKLRAVLEAEAKAAHKDTHGDYLSFSVTSLLFAKAAYTILHIKQMLNISEMAYENAVSDIDNLIERTFYLEAEKKILPDNMEFSGTDITKADGRAVFPADVNMAKALAIDFVNSQIKAENSYMIKYDLGRISSSQIAIIKQYASLLSEKFDADIKAVPFDSGITEKNAGQQPLISVYARNRNGTITGQGHIDIGLPDKEKIGDYILRITGMLNIAFAASNIPDESKDITQGLFNDKYGHILGFIRNQHLKISGQELRLPDDLGSLISAVKNIILILPEIYKVSDRREIEKYNERARMTLIHA